MTEPGDRQLEIDGISKRYGQTVAVQDLTFQVHAGELFGFVGRNGAGKTTTMRIVLGVLAADAGVVRWDGRPLDFATRRRIGYMPEERGLYPKMRVAEQLAYLGELHGMTGSGSPGGRARLAGPVRPGRPARRGPPGPQPGQPAAGPAGRGTRLRAGSARPRRAVRRARPGRRRRDGGRASRAAEAGVPVIFSSHELELVERICDRVGIIDHGRMLACGTVAELRAGGRERRWVDVPGAPDPWEPGIAGRRGSCRPTAHERLFELDPGRRRPGAAPGGAGHRTGARVRARRAQPRRALPDGHRGGSGMNARSWSPGGTRHLPTIVLVARREIRMRLRSRVFLGGTIVMTVLVVVGIVAASLLAGKTTPVRVGFSGGSQALERAFTAIGRGPGCERDGQRHRRRHRRGGAGDGGHARRARDGFGDRADGRGRRP